MSKGSKEVKEVKGAKAIYDYLKNLNKKIRQVYSTTNILIRSLNSPCTPTKSNIISYYKKRYLCKLVIILKVTFLCSKECPSGS